MSSLLTHRSLFLLAFISCIGLLGFGYYLEFVEGLAPCPLCITQRFFFLLCALTGLIAFLHGVRSVGRRLYGLLLSVFAAAGAGFAGRQLWLQSLPEDQVPACGPSIEYMFSSLPFADAFDLLLMGDGNCAEVTWSFLGLSIPGWAILCFTGLLFLGLYQLFSKTPN